MQAGNITISGADYVQQVKLRRPGAAIRQSPSGSRSIISCRAYRGFPLAGLAGRWKVTTIGRNTYRMFITIAALGLLDLVQDIGVAASVTHYDAYWLRAASVAG